MPKDNKLRSQIITLHHDSPVIRHLGKLSCTALPISFFIYLNSFLLKTFSALLYFLLFYTIPYYSNSALPALLLSSQSLINCYYLLSVSRHLI